MFDSVSDDVSDNRSSWHVVSVSSVLLNVGKVMTFLGSGVGHLFLHLLSFTGLSSVSLIYNALGS